MASTGPMIVVLRPRRESFDQKLWKMLVADEVAQSKATEIVGLDFDPILNTQDPSPKYLVNRVSMRGGHCNPVVVAVSHGVQGEDVMPELIRSNGRWIFVNFHYRSEDNGKVEDTDLLQMLNELKEERSK